MKATKSLWFSTILLAVTPHGQSAEVTSIANGLWTATTVWSDSAAPTAANNYTIDGETVNTPDGGGTFAGGSLTVTSPGILRIDRTSTGTANATVPNLTLAGGELRFNTGQYDSTFNLNSPVVFQTDTTSTLRLQGGQFTHVVNLNQALSGAGNVNFITDRADSNDNRSSLYVKSANNNTFSGNWTVSSADTGTADRANLYAAAANALGTGTVTLSARGVLQVSAANGIDSLAGVVVDDANAGLNLNGNNWSNASAALTLNNGTVNFGAAATAIGSHTQSGGTLNAGTGSLTTGTFTQDGGTINVQAGSGLAAPILVSGNATYTAGTISVSLQSVVPGVSYDLLQYGGTLSGSPVVSFSGDTGRLTQAVNYGTGSNDKITVSLTGSVANLVWTGANSDNWDNNTTQNFTNLGSPDVFRSFDNVLFDDSTTFTSPLLVGTLNTGTVTFNNTSDYTLGGAGSIAAGSLSKSGTGKLTISNTTANTFTGNVTITGGTLVAGSTTALGAAVVGGGTYISGGGTLDVNNKNLGAELVVIEDTGVDGNGVIVNSGAAQQNALRFVTLSGDASIGGTNRWDIRGAATATLDLAGHKLTKIGANYVPVVNATITSGDIDVNEGTFALSVATTMTGSGTVSVNNNGILEIGFGTTGSNITRNVVMNQGSLTSPSGANGINSDIAFNADTTIGVTGTSLTLGGALSDTGSARTLTKTGSGTLFVSSAASTRTGAMVIDDGIVQVNASGALGSGLITIGQTNTGANNHALQLSGATIDNSVESRYMYTNYLGTITAVGGSASTITGDVTIHPSVVPATTRGGHLASSGTGSILRLMGELNVGGSQNTITQRDGTVEYGGGASTSYSLGVTGTARLAAENGLGTGVLAKLGVSGAATLDLNGFNQTLDGVVREVATNTTTITNQGAADAVLTVSPTADRTYSGAIQDGTTNTLSLVKTGSYLYAITGNNTYTGTTTVQGGTLADSGSSASDLTVKTGATLAPGNGVGSFKTNASTFETGSSLAMEIDSSTTSSDLLDSYGNATIQSGVTLSLTDAATTPAELAVGTKLTLINYVGMTLSGTFDGLPEGATITVGSNKFTISYVDADAVTLTAAGGANNFATWSAANAGGQAANLDFDNDGVSNGVEYFMGQTGSSFTAMPAIVNNAGTLSITWTKGASYLGVYGTDFVVETSDTLAGGSWTTETLGGNVAISGNNVTYTFPAGPAKKFARLKVTGP